MPTFALLAGCVVAAGSVRLAGAQAAATSPAIGAVTVTVNGRSHAGRFQSVEGIALSAETADVAHIDGRIDKATLREPPVARVPSAAKPAAFSLVVSVSDPVAAFPSTNQDLSVEGLTH